MASEIKKKLFWRAVVAEFLAMTLFVFISIGSALGFNYPLERNQTLVQDNVKVSLAFGLSIATLAQSVGHISGAHLNPAVTLGLLLSCQISILRAVMYIIAQCVGAIVASAILSGITSSLLENSLGRNDLARGVNSGQGLGIEIIGTLQLVLCVLATTDRRRRDLGGSAPLAIGLSVALGHLLAIDYTGCGINPARSFGSAVLTRNFSNHWVSHHGQPGARHCFPLRDSGRQAGQRKSRTNPETKGGVQIIKDLCHLYSGSSNLLTVW